ncbi:MAG: aminotransferase class V-fold PLP-dependent enzyme [Candidatus Eisenbacteria bacterium]|nr:aminotransferase class V-fold PLP-dependent enzyme [Candidatus Eisenbacteria bacterium]
MFGEYLDHNAAAPLRPEVLGALMLAMEQQQANPGSAHGAGRFWRRRIDAARREVAGLVGAQPHEIVLTGSGTEACFLALHGVIEAARTRSVEPPLVLATPIEHAAIREPLCAMAARGTIRLLLCPVGASGRVDADWFADHLTQIPVLVVCQWANNETGVIQPVLEVADLCRAHETRLLVDAVQWAGRGPIDLTAQPIDLLVLSSPKLGGPTGAGALFIREGLALEPYLVAGKQEGGLRGGTENSLGWIGFGAAAAAARETWAAEVAHEAPLTARLVEQVLARVPGARLAGDGSTRIANTAQFLVPHDDEEMLILALDRLGYAVSAGSACAAGAHERSHVLRAMGLLEPGFASVRVSIGSGTTARAIDDFVTALCTGIQAARPDEAEVAR